MVGPQSVIHEDGTQVISLVGANPSQSTVTNLEYIRGEVTDPHMVYGESFQEDTAGNRYVYHWSKPMEGFFGTSAALNGTDGDGNVLLGSNLNSLNIGEVNVERIVYTSPDTNPFSPTNTDSTVSHHFGLYSQPRMELDFATGHGGFRIGTNGTGTIGDLNITFNDGNQFIWNGDNNGPQQGYVRPNGRRVVEIGEGPNEKANSLLSRMIGEKAFRGYLRNGFVSYRGKSGKIYQVFPGYGETQVWDKGQPVERLCLIFKDSKLPPTDSVIMRLLMLEHDEEEFRKLANVHAFRPNRTRYTDPVVERGRILRMAKNKNAGGALFMQPNTQLMISADTAQQYTIRVA